MPGAESVVCPPLLFHPSDTTLMGLSLSTSCSVTEFTQPEGTAMQPLPPSAVVLNFMISHLAAKFHLARHLACQCCFISCCDLVPPRLSCRCDPSLGLFLPLHSDRHHNHTRFPHCVMCSDVGAFLWQCQPFSPRFVQNFVVPLQKQWHTFKVQGTKRKRRASLGLTTGVEVSTLCHHQGPGRRSVTSN